MTSICFFVSLPPLGVGNHRPFLPCLFCRPFQYYASFVPFIFSRLYKNWFYGSDPPSFLCSTAIEINDLRLSPGVTGFEDVPPPKLYHISGHLTDLCSRPHTEPLFVCVFCGRRVTVSSWDPELFFVALVRMTRGDLYHATLWTSSIFGVC